MTSTPTSTATVTPSSTLTASPSITPTYTISPTNSVTPTITETFTISPTFTNSSTASPTFTAVTNAAVAIPRPNPFWPERGQNLYLDIDVAAPGPVKVKAFNLAGELVCIIADKDLGNGRNVISWNGVNSVGDVVASGTYFILVEAPGGLQKRFLVGVLK